MTLSSTTAKPRNWILVRGLIRGSYHWHEFPDKLAKAFPNDKVHLFDIPGNGLRYSELSPMNIASYTEDLRFLARRLDRIHIVSISLGGMIVMDWLANHPEEVERTFIMNTSLGDTAPFYKRLNYWNYPKIARSIMADEAVVEKLILDLTSNNLKLHPDVLDFNIKMARKYPMNRLNFFQQLLAAGRSRFNPRLRDYKNLHLLVSANDRLVHCDNTFNLSQKLGIAPAVHPWAGHDLTLDDPDFVVNECLTHTISTNI